MSVAHLTGFQMIVFICSSIPVGLFDNPRDLQVSHHVVSADSLSLLHYRLNL